MGFGGLPLNFKLDFILLGWLAAIDFSLCIHYKISTMTDSLPNMELQVLQREAGTAHHCQRGSCNDQPFHAATHNNNIVENHRALLVNLYTVVSHVCKG